MPIEPRAGVFRAPAFSLREAAPADLAEAVKEALVISNENPSPADYGIEIDVCEAHLHSG